MTAYWRRRRAACATAALTLTLAAAPITAHAVAAESQADRGAVRALEPCAEANAPVTIAPGYDGLYTHSADMVSGCSVVTNVGTLPLQLWSDNGSVIGAPARPATPAGWATETAARQILLGLPRGRVVVLPGEQAVLYQPPPAYTVDVVPLELTQEAVFAAQYAGLAKDLAERDGVQVVPLPLYNRLGNAINKCAKAAAGTFNELRQEGAVNSLADIFDQAKGLPSCKTAYSMLDPSSTSADKPSLLEKWRQKVTRFNVKWNTQLVDDIVTRIPSSLGKLHR
ncbi:MULTISPECIES: hypothetical protein [unclassified Streptomyces]|uniref:hypothetical protein n=1 Tax=Streptomyces sp. NPDC055082 TaxID=3365718 RepID=UPI0037D1A359